ncbi:nucleotide exchange factor GrpE [Sediminimonas sp.]|uniref:nucleotide exchange factor GrpE n=1 Tax=Sediminimonas sp. TaxID=2823379 RepID=UPI0025CE2970|nr:nucleotide exchange factor GrpE [Sediminimonas sp.]
MADPKNDEFLDDIDAAESEEYADRAAEMDDVEVELDSLRAERDDYRDRFMRALADAENTRKRSEKDRREAEKYGGSKLARDMLPVYDNLKRALDAATDEQRAAFGPLLEGVELTMRELLSVFSKHGIEPVSPQVGDRFDPQLHQAMFEAPVPNTTAGEIIQVSTEGFLLHDRLLRPAQVGVSSMVAQNAGSGGK